MNGLTGVTELSGVSPAALEAHTKSLVVNLLDGTVLPRHLPGFPIDRYLEDLHRGGVTAFVTCVAAHHEDDFSLATMRLMRWHRLVQSVAPNLKVILSPEDLREVKRRKSVGVIFQFQDPKPIEDNLLYVEAFYRLGLRILQLTYQRRNLAGDGCGEPSDGGVSAFGRELIRECNKLGVLVDLAHAGHRTILDAISISNAPVLISHTAAHALYPHPRNIRDEHIKAVADNGGLVGVHALAYLLRRNGGSEGASIQDVVAHIDYIAELVGVDYIGIGTDVGTNVVPTEVQVRERAWGRLGEEFPELFVPGFNFQKRYAQGLEASSGLPRLSEALIVRGYTPGDVQKIMGGNFLRVFGEAVKKVEPSQSAAAEGT